MSVKTPIHLALIVIFALAGRVSAPQLTESPEYQEILRYMRDLSFASYRGEKDSHFDQSRLEGIISKKPEVLREVDSFKNTLLHWAVVTINPPCVDFLIQQGADVNAKDECMRTPLMRAIDRMHSSLIASLNLKQKADAKKIMSLLINNKKVDLEARNQQGKTPLELAIWLDESAVEIAELLIKRGADVNAQALWCEGGASLQSLTFHQCSLLHNAIRTKNTKIVELLVTNGADCKALDECGLTPLDLAQELGLIDMCDLLRGSHVVLGSGFVL